MEADRQNDIDSQVQPTRVGDVPDPTHMTPDDLHYLSELHDDLAETHTQCEKRETHHGYGPKAFSGGAGSVS